MIPAYRPDARHTRRRTDKGWSLRPSVMYREARPNREVVVTQRHRRHYKVRSAPAGASKDRWLVALWTAALRARPAWRLTLSALAERTQQKSKATLCRFRRAAHGRQGRPRKPLVERKEILKGLLPRDPLLRYNEHVAEFGEREFATVMRWPLR
jgi:hypothetical protein